MGFEACLYRFLMYILVYLESSPRVSGTNLLVQFYNMLRFSLPGLAVFLSRAGKQTTSAVMPHPSSEGDEGKSLFEKNCNLIL